MLPYFFDHSWINWIVDGALQSVRLCPKNNFAGGPGILFRLKYSKAFCVRFKYMNKNNMKIVMRINNRAIINIFFVGRTVNFQICFYNALISSQHRFYMGDSQDWRMSTYFADDTENSPSTFEDVLVVYNESSIFVSLISARKFSAIMLLIV